MKTNLVKLTCGLVVLGVAATTLAQGNLILNGSLEDNTAPGSSQFAGMMLGGNADLNPYISNVTYFGPDNGASLLYTGDGPVTAEDGQWYAGLANDGGGNYDALAFNLSSAIVSGASYQLGFHAQAYNYLPGGNVEIGISSSPNSFGTEVYSGAPGTGAWDYFTATFTAPTDATYLTVMEQSSTYTWNFVDNVSLVPEATPEPSTLALTGLGGLGMLRTLRRRE